MGRPADGVDLGAWAIDPALLLVPVDVHVHRLARNLGLTRQRTPSWRTTEEITDALARFDPTDPTKYDFSLCHMGMLQRCPSRRDARRCEGCGVKPVCVHWQDWRVRRAGPRSG
jgi:endonuclease III